MQIFSIFCSSEGGNCAKTLYFSLNEIVKKTTLNRKTIDINPLEYGRIVCAALFHNNCIYMGKEGHHVIFPMEPLGVLRGAKQGFVTENGFFVNREVGLYKGSGHQCLVSDSYFSVSFQSQI